MYQTAILGYLLPEDVRTPHSKYIFEVIGNFQICPRDKATTELNVSLLTVIES